jgi:hypothetical protein
VITVRIKAHAGAFAEDKDVAARIRDETIRPALEGKGTVRLDFTGVDGATQSFVHAMVSDLIRSRGAGVLGRMEFKACNSTIRSVVEIVAEYSQLEEPAVGPQVPPNTRMQRTGRPKKKRLASGSASGRRVSGRPPRRAGR